MGGIDPELFKKVVQPLLDSSLMKEENGQYSIASANEIEPAKLSNARMTTADYTELVATSTSVQVTLERDQQQQSAQEAANTANGALLQYSHPKHKHRVMAFIIKTVKRQAMNLATLVEMTIQNFTGKGIDLAEANITKNITELQEKELISTEGRMITYIP